MIRRNQSILVLLNCITDFLLILVSYFLSVFIRYTLFDASLDVLLFSGYYVHIVLYYSIIVILLYYVSDLYGSFRFMQRRSEYLKITVINAVGVIGLMAVYYMIKVVDVSRWMLAIFWALSSGLVVFKRYMFLRILKKKRISGHNLKHILIVGNGNHALCFTKDIKAHPEYGIWINGYIAGSSSPELDSEIIGFHSNRDQKINGSAFLGSFDTLESILESNQFDSVVIALEKDELDHMQYVMSAADKEGIRIELIPFYNDYIPANPSIETIGQTKLIDLRSTPLDKPLFAFAKRFIDIVGSLILIIITSPLMLICAAGVRISSPGPVIFKQQRVGKDKKLFTMYKFRSMRVNDTQDIAWSTDEDDRKTRFGSFIRKYSLDELPQFFNVLAGDMSLVGPRPEIPFHVNHFKNDIPRYLVRQQVRPGITGWAQINGFRGDTLIEDRVECDIWYIENWTLGLDIKILLDTVFKGHFKNNEVINR